MSRGSFLFGPAVLALVISACAPGDNPVIEPSHVSVWESNRTTYLIHELSPAEYLQRTEHGLVSRPDLEVRIGGVTGDIQHADGAGIHVRLPESLAVGFHDLEVRGASVHRSSSALEVRAPAPAPDAGTDAAPAADADVGPAPAADADVGPARDAGTGEDGGCDPCGDEDASSCAADCPDTCGDGLCTGAENPATCPADCPDVCGDSVCTGLEDTCSCNSDCGSSCGDGCCNGSETEVSCVADCQICSSSCSSGACSETCGAGCDLTCNDRGCNCDYDCAAVPGTCEVTCQSRATCDVDCSGSNECDLECQNDTVCGFDCSDVTGLCVAECKSGGICQIDCTNADDCRPNCHDRDVLCDIDCSFATSCDVDCASGAACIVDCTGATTCGFRHCSGGETSCPGNLVVCNRACP